MTIFALFVSLMMLLAAGVAIDLTRREQARTLIQNTLDRAVLAAASEGQTEAPEAVVQDYLRAAGLEGFPVAVDHDPAVHPKQVAARIDGLVPTRFMRMIGIRQMDVTASSEARHGRVDLELSIVLDLSGSMDESSGLPGKTRMEAMQDAAKDFVREVVVGHEDQVRVNVVGYADYVNIGPTLQRYWPLDAWHDRSYCARHDRADFTDTFVDPAGSRRQVGHFARFWNGLGTVADPVGPIRPLCRTDRGALPLVMSNDAAEIITHIDSFYPWSGTGIHDGMLWGATFLDPRARPTFQSMIAAGDLGAHASARPLDFDAPGVFKAVVVLSDGQNEDKYELAQRARSGPSGVFAWRSDFATMADAEIRAAIAQDDHSITFSIRHPDHPDRFYAGYGDGTQLSAPIGSDASGADAVELSWPQLLDIKAPQHVGTMGEFDYQSNGAMAEHMPYDVREHYRRVIWSPKHKTRGSDNTWNDLRNICQATKDAGIVVFTIGFNIDRDEAADLMRNCASGPTKFYEVRDGDLGPVFDSIAGKLSRLTLTR